MAKVFNVTAHCKPEQHYMVDITERLAKIKELVDRGAYFTINRARQYGKTTILRALNGYLQQEYYVVLIDFQTINSAKFKNENTFSLTFARMFLQKLKNNKTLADGEIASITRELDRQVGERNPEFELPELFEELSSICANTDKKIVLMIDEIDSATNNQVFLDFLSQLRAYYINQDVQPALYSVILASVYDIKNLKRKIRPDSNHKSNSPWNIATEFNIDMSFSKNEIAKMLYEYEADYHTNMNIYTIAKLLYDYTSGYPFLVSKLCKLIDEEVSHKEMFGTKDKSWTESGFYEAVKMILEEKNTLFESLSEKLESYPELDSVLYSLLFTGKTVIYNFYEPSINTATMFGFVKKQNGMLAISNRIFETWLYNLYLSTSKLQSSDIYIASLHDRNQFIVNDNLDMKLILEKFV